MIDSRSKIGGIKPSFLMRKLLIPLLVALTLPTSENAESVWLWLRATHANGGASQEKILMGSLEQCEEEGERWVMAVSKSSLDRRNWRIFHCFIGK